MRRRLSDHSGFTIVELIIVCAVLGIVMTGLVNIFVSSTRAQSDADARLQAQQNVRLAIDRLQYEARCASSATLVSSGAGVTLTLPTVCSHANGTITWCVVSGVLRRSVGSTCSASGQIFVSSITSTQPFSLPAAVSGNLPQLTVSLTSNTTGRTSDAFTDNDVITLRNGTRAP
jgi:prepilin-type N-terminal cleavage/methylation domain-containing protein